MITRPTTKDLLAASLQELAQHKSIDRITVKEIVQNCQLTATTFYNHFQDKYALLAWIFHKEIEPLYTRLGKDFDWDDLITQSIHIIHRNRLFYRNALKNTSGQTSFQKATCDYNINRIKSFICQQQGITVLSDELQFMIQFYVVGTSHFTREWILHEDELPSEEFIQRLRKAMPQELRFYLWNYPK